MKIKLENGINLVFKKDGILEDSRNYRKSLFEKGEVVVFNGYDCRWSGNKMCMVRDGEYKDYLCEVEEIDELFEVVND